LKYAVKSNPILFFLLGTIYNKETQLLVYVDDINIVGRSQPAVWDAYLALEGKAAKVGLKINEQ
jgi:hypothetical protein